MTYAGGFGMAGEVVLVVAALFGTSSMRGGALEGVVAEAPEELPEAMLGRGASLKTEAFARATLQGGGPS